jgi:hypothetical protein
MDDEATAPEGYPEEQDHTHKVTINVYSKGKDNMISVKINWTPDLEGKDFTEIGYFPASFGFVEDFLIPAIEQGYEEWAAGPLSDMSSPSNYKH